MTKSSPCRRVLLHAGIGCLIAWFTGTVVACQETPAGADAVVLNQEVTGIEGMVTKTVKMPDGSVVTVSLPEGAALPEGSVEIPADAVAAGQPAGDAAATPEGEAAAAAAEAPAVGSVKRSDRPKAEADPEEFKARPGEDGTIEFQFKDQPWPELLEWLAEVSSMSLDWQELPDDTLNISTQRPYTLAEARDLFNRHLLMRGYTLLEFEGMLQVAKVEGINPALVPRVESVDLVLLPRNRFVRTTFVLRTLLADTMLDELKTLLSKNGKLQAMTTTNRLEAMDSAGNLLDLARTLSQEQSAEAQAGLAREFPLTWVRAETVKQQLEVFLSQRSVPTDNLTPEQVQQLIQQQHELAVQELAARTAAEQAAQAAQAAGQPVAPVAKARSSSVSIHANTRRNSLIINAPPDKIAVIEVFIRAVDVPVDPEALDAIASRVRVYRLAELDPKAFIAALHQLDILEVSTELRVDEDNQAVIANASPRDQVIIQELQDRLDGSARQFQVIQLRKHKAADVAGTIRTMLGLDDESDSSSSRRNYYWWDEPEKKKSNDKFRVGANVRDNQILTWANELEREKIRGLLAELGEVSGEPTANNSRIRTIDASRSPETLEYLRRIQAMWEQGEATPLILPSADEFDSDPVRPSNDAPAPDQLPDNGNGPDATRPGPLVSPEENGSVTPAKSTAREAAGSQNGMLEQTSRFGRSVAGEFSPAITFVAGPNPGAGFALTTSPGDQEPVSAPAPRIDESGASAGGARRPARGDEKDAVRIGFDSRGNLVLFSDNLAALDRLERLMAEFKPPQREFETFYVEHADALWISGKLGTYFRNREPSKSQNNAFFSWYFDDMMPERDKQPENSLDSRPPLKFLADIDTKSIIVQGADNADLETIGQLIDLWDVPETPRQTNVRRTQLIKIRYTKADLLVATVKEVYRDLLSATDSSFQTPPSGNGDKNDSADAPPPPRPFSFSGNISLGVDKVTNTIIVSATGSQSEDILKMVSGLINQLDEEARPRGVTEVVRVDLGQRGENLEKLLKTMLQSKADQLTQPSEQPAQPAAEPPAAEQAPQVTSESVDQQVAPAQGNNSGEDD